MDFGAALRRAWRIAQLDVTAIAEVAGDQNATVPALIILAIAGFAAGIGGVLQRLVWHLPGGVFVGIMMIIPLAILVPLFTFIVVGIWHLLAKLFGGQGAYMPLYNCYGHGGGLVSCLGIVPFIGSIIGGIWSVVIAVITVSEVHKLSRGKAVLVVLIPVVVLGALCCAAIMFGALAALTAIRAHSN